MKEFEYVITDPVGIHARPATLLVKHASAFSSNIKLGHNGREVNAKQILGVMSLGVKKGETVIVKAEGDDEEKAVADLEAFLKENM